jgi:hypothetical protein
MIGPNVRLAQGERVVLVLLQVAGLVLLGFDITAAVRSWDTPTAIDPGSVAFVWYIVVFWLEVIAIVGLAITFARTKRMPLMAPSVLIIVGAHFVPLAFVFGQPIMMLAAVLTTAAGVAVLFLPGKVAAPSFWCGVFAAPIFVVLGAVALISTTAALGT